VTGVNHVGLTVPHLESAIEWYRAVFDMPLLAGPIECDLYTRGAQRRREIFGPSWGGMRIAHLGSSNGAGIELFEFIRPPVVVPDDNFPFATVGLHHVALTVADFEETLGRVLAHGGRQRCAPSEIYAGVLVCYCEDRWGNVIEITNAEYDRLARATTVTDPST